jgi:RNA polymerase sigma factor (sigma-70 family)
VQDALVEALAAWPERGVPEKPGAWLMTAARHRGLDRLRRDAGLRERHAALAGELARDTAIAAGGDPTAAEALAAADEGAVRDDLLRLLATTCHPALSPDARVALTLRLLGGLTTAEIARAFLVPEPTVAQRISRAKAVLAEHGYAEASVADLETRMGGVLEVVYLVFNEGHVATGGDALVREDLCREALRLARLAAELVPGDAEALGLVALLELQIARLPARTGPDGELVALLDQDRSRWDHDAAGRGLAALDRARAAGGGALGPYGLQAAIAACHARAATAEATDWAAIAALYGVLADVAPSPVVELNRAAAIGMADGAVAGLARLDAVADRLDGYHPYHAVRAGLLERDGRGEEAAAAYRRAAALTGNGAERAELARRAARLG